MLFLEFQGWKNSLLSVPVISDIWTLNLIVRSQKLKHRATNLNKASMFLEPPSWPSLI